MLKKDIKFDCRYFDGTRPCQFKLPCKSCNFYNPIGKKILIIKLASAGDVLRTTVLLAALRKKYPGSFITWLVKEPAQELLENSPYIDRILIYNLESVLSLEVEGFDIVISLDKAIEATSLATLISASEKYGYGLNKEGKIFPFNKEAAYSFLLGIDDDLKFFKNKKTYQELIFDVVKLPYKNEQYELRLDSRELNFAEEFFKNNSLNKDDLVVGINTGAGKVFANKNLSRDRIIELIKLLNKQMNVKILLLGGPLEKETNEYIAKNVSCQIVDSRCTHNLREFSALINNCSLVITSDTLALHIAVALKKLVIALFGPTCPQEIGLYSRGYKIIANIDCAPCYKNECDKEPSCMDKINLGEIVKAAKGLSKIAEKV